MQILSRLTICKKNIGVQFTVHRRQKPLPFLVQQYLDLRHLCKRLLGALILRVCTAEMH